MSKNLENCERETTINVLQTEKMADVYTCMRWERVKLEKLAEKYPDKVILESQDEYGVSYKVPKLWIRIRPPRVMSEEQREKARQRLSAYWSHKKEGEDV